MISKFNSKIYATGRIIVLRLIPKKLIQNIILQTAFKGYKHDVSQDFKIWENKIYVTLPALAKGDGPVWQYREWARQFYYSEELVPFKPPS